MRIANYLVIVLCLLPLLGCKSAESKTEPKATGNIDYADLLSAGPGSWPPLESHRLAGVDDANAEAANATAHLALQKRVDFDFGPVTFEQTIDYLRDVTGANVAVNWPALELVGIDQDTVIDLELEQVRVEQLLGLVLDQVGATQFDDDKTDYRIQEGVVVISTRGDLKTMTETRVYDVRNLIYLHPTLIESVYADLEAVEHFAELLRQGDLPLDYPRFDLSLISEAGGGFGPTSRITDGGGGAVASEGGIFGNDEKEEEDTRTALQIQRDRRSDQLSDFIQDMVGDPDEWLDEESTICEINGKFIIKTTPANHEQVSMLLTAVARSQVQHFQRQARLVELLILLRRAEKHRLNQEYRSALRCLDQALRVDPENPEALALRELVEEVLSR